MDVGDILPAGDYLETNLHPIRVWGAKGGGGGRGLGVWKFFYSFQFTKPD